jgi:hypothetical protein
LRDAMIRATEADSRFPNHSDSGRNAMAKPPRKPSRPPSRPARAGRANAQAAPPVSPTVEDAAQAAIAEATTRAPSLPPPPQGAGAPLRLFNTGSPASVERLNVALRVLRDPIARASFSRVYSGQLRNWNR